MPLTDFIRRRIRTSGSNPTFASGSEWQRAPIAATSLSVTDDRALGLTAVYRAVYLISSTAASLPLHIYEKKRDGTRERSEQPNTALLWDRPNPEMSAQTFWEMVFGHEVLGDAFIWVAKNKDEQALQLWPIDPWRVQVGRTREKYGDPPARRKVYQLDGDPNTAMMDFAEGGEIIHVPNWGRSNLRGISPIQLAANALSLGMSAQSYAERFFSQSTVPQGIITTDADLSQEQAEQLAAIWARQRSGLLNAHRDAVLSSGATYKQVSVSPADAQLLESRRYSVLEVCRMFGVPPWKLYDMDHASQGGGNGMEDQNWQFLSETMISHLSRFEQAINHALLGGWQSGRYAKFNVEGLLRATTLNRFQSYALGYGRWYSTNDIRRLEGLPPVDGGDDVLAAQNLVPLDMLGNVQGTGTEDATATSGGRAPGAQTLGLLLAATKGD